MVGNWARSRLCAKSSWISRVRCCCSCPHVRWIGQVRWYSLSVVDIDGVTRSLRVSLERCGIALSITGQISRRPMSPGRGSACLSKPLGYRHSRNAAVKAPGWLSRSSEKPIPPFLLGNMKRILSSHWSMLTLNWPVISSAWSQNQQLSINSTTLCSGVEVRKSAYSFGSRFGRYLI